MSPVYHVQYYPKSHGHHEKVESYSYYDGIDQEVDYTDIPSHYHSETVMNGFVLARLQHLVRQNYHLWVHMG
jgi:hypothetical protein